MRFRSNLSAIVAVAGGFVLSLGLGSPALASSRPDAMCRSHLFAAVGKLARDTIVELGKCHAQRMAAQLPAAALCNSSATAPNRLLLRRDEDNLRTRVRKRCGEADVSPPAALGFTSCPAPCEATGPVTTYADVAECLICRTRAETSRLVTDVFGDPPRPAGSELQCQRRIGRMTKIYLAAQINAQRRCHIARDLGRLSATTDCRTYDPSGKVQTAAQRVRQAISLCTDDQLDELDSCAEDVEGEVACVPAVTDTTAAALYATVFSMQTSTIAVGSATGERGQTVTIPVALTGGGGITNGASVDIDFDPNQVVVAQLAGHPACTINPSIGAGTAADKTLVAALIPRSDDLQTLRVSVLGFGPAVALPDGVLFDCDFVITNSAPLGNATLAASSYTFDAFANLLPNFATDGAVIVQPTGIPAIALNDERGRPSEAVAITATLSNGDGRVAAVNASIAFDSSDVAVAGGSVPDCTIASAIGAGSAADKHLSTSLSVDGSVHTLTVTVASSTNANLIPDGPLFTCNFEIAPSAGLGVKLLANDTAAFDASGSSVAIATRDGRVTVFSSLLQIGSIAGISGQPVSIPMTLSDGDDIVEAQIDLTYDASQIRAALAAGTPDCTIAPAIGAGTAAEKVLTATTLAGSGDMETLRLELTSPTNSEELPDGVLLTCRFAIVTGASDGSHALQATATALDAAGVAIPISVADGAIVVVTQLPRIDVGHASGDPGDTVSIDVSFLNEQNVTITAVSSDVRYDAQSVRVKRSGSSIDCTINPAIGFGTVPGKMLLLSTADVGGGIERLRAGVISFSNINAIPDGRLYTCRFVIDPGAAAGIVPLNQTPAASDPSGNEEMIYGSDGSVTIF